MGLFDRFKKRPKDDDDEEMIVINIYECVFAAYYQNRDEDDAWPLDEFSEVDPVENLEVLADMLPDYFEYNGEPNRGVVYLGPEATGMKTLNKKDLKNEFLLIADSAKKLGEALHNLLELEGVLEGNETYLGVELRAGKVRPEAILIPDSNIVLLHCELGLKYSIH